MPNLTSKKTKTLHTNSLIKNQISNILQPVNGTVNLNVQKTNTISTQSAASQSYYIPLLEKITGEQSINVKAPLSFNATTNTLSVPNLTISNLPTCNVDASNSSDLVNKSYANTYAYFDLAGGDRWECEDWITGSTKGKYNWNLSANNANITTEIFMFDLCANHIGILGINSRNSIGFKQVKLPITYNSNKMKSMRVITTLANANNNDLRIGFFDNNVDTSTNNFFWKFSGNSEVNS